MALQMWTSAQGTTDASTDVRTCWVVSAAAALRGTFNTTSGTSVWVSVLQYSFSNQPTKLRIIKTKKCKNTTWKLSVNIEIVNCTCLLIIITLIITWLSVTRLCLAPCKYHSKIFLQLKLSDFKKSTKKCGFQMCNLIVYYSVCC